MQRRGDDVLELRRHQVEARLPKLVRNANRFVRARYCAEEGDSGAGVYRNHKALGIQSGMRLECGDTADPELWGAIFGHIEYAQNAVNADLVFVPE